MPHVQHYFVNKNLGITVNYRDQKRKKMVLKIPDFIFSQNIFMLLRNAF